MATRRKGWSQLSPDYKRRLQRAGITKSKYEKGVSLSAARGHSKTPEHGLKEALFVNPGKYREYLRTRQPKGQDALAEALDMNDKLDKAFEHMARELGGLPKYNNDTVRANVYGGVTAESGVVDGMKYPEALWTIAAQQGELRAAASPQYKGNPWYYH